MLYNTGSLMSNANKYINKRSLAERLSVSERTVSNWVASRKIPFWKIRRTLRFDPNDVDKALEAFKHNEIRLDNN